MFCKRRIKKIEDDKIYLIDEKEVLREIGCFISNDFYSYGGYEGWDTEMSGYENMNFIKEDIDLAFRSCIGYVPEYRYIDATMQIEIKEDKRIYTDLSYYVNNISLINGLIVFNALELLMNLEAFY